MGGSVSRRAQLPQGTDIGSPAHTLTAAALVSVKLPLDPNSGQRPGDPLTVLVTDTNWREWIEVAEEVTDWHVTVERGDALMAARIRATLRRWAIKQ